MQTKWIHLTVPVFVCLTMFLGTSSTVGTTTNSPNFIYSPHACNKAVPYAGHVFISRQKHIREQNKNNKTASSPYLLQSSQPYCQLTSRHECSWSNERVFGTIDTTNRLIYRFRLKSKSIFSRLLLIFYLQNDLNVDFPFKIWIQLCGHTNYVDL